jgi:Uma2 family endonuclease
VAFIREERLKEIKHQNSYLPFAPDLAVEILPPEKTKAEFERRSALYLRGGTPLVWMIYPSSRTVVVHHPDGSSQAIGIEGALDGENVLPELHIPLAKLFPPEQE